MEDNANENQLRASLAEDFRDIEQLNSDRTELYEEEFLPAFKAVLEKDPSAEAVAIFQNANFRLRGIESQLEALQQRASETQEAIDALGK